MSTARMLRSELCACFNACIAASSVDVLELPTSSMILTTATLSSCSSAGWNAATGVLSGMSAPGKHRGARDALIERRPLPSALRLLERRRGRGGVGEELLERGDDRGRFALRVG